MINEIFLWNAWKQKQNAIEGQEFHDCGKHNDI